LRLRVVERAKLPSKRPVEQRDRLCTKGNGSTQQKTLRFLLFADENRMRRVGPALAAGPQFIGNRPADKRRLYIQLLLAEKSSSNPSRSMSSNSAARLAVILPFSIVECRRLTKPTSKRGGTGFFSSFRDKSAFSNSRPGSRRYRPSTNRQYAARSETSKCLATCITRSWSEPWQCAHTR
jgi:hypothetical protein